MRAGPRLALCALVGLAIFLMGPLFSSFLRSERELTVMAAWSGVCLTFLLAVWFTLARVDGEATRRFSERQDDARAAARVLVITGSLISLFAVGSGLLRSRQGAAQDHLVENVVVVATVVTVVLTWLLIHVEAMLHYARLYYDGDDGGVDFGNERPSYNDFAYLAFTVGMTFQVSDTPVTDARIRRAVLHHALLSHLFGTILVALTINGVASLAG